MTRRWNICDQDDNCLAQIEADSDYEALSKFFVSRGYSATIDDDEVSYLYGRLHSPFENFEVMVY
jgi:hypothetical protein